MSPDDFSRNDPSTLVEEVWDILESADFPDPVIQSVIRLIEAEEQRRAEELARWLAEAEAKAQADELAFWAEQDARGIEHHLEDFQSPPLPGH